MLTAEQIKEAEGLSAVEAIRRVTTWFPQGVVFSSSLGQEDQVLTDLIVTHCGGEAGPVVRAGAPPAARRSTPRSRGARIARRDLSARFRGLRLLLVCLFLGVGAGAISQVIVEVGGYLVRSSRPRGAWLSSTNVAGFAAGLVVMYLTAFLVNV